MAQVQHAAFHGLRNFDKEERFIERDPQHACVVKDGLLLCGGQKIYRGCEEAMAVLRLVIPQRGQEGAGLIPLKRQDLDELRHPVVELTGSRRKSLIVTDGVSFLYTR